MRRGPLTLHSMQPSPLPNGPAPLATTAISTTATPAFSHPLLSFRLQQDPMDEPSMFAAGWPAFAFAAPFVPGIFRRLSPARLLSKTIQVPASLNGNGHLI